MNDQGLNDIFQKIGETVESIANTVEDLTSPENLAELKHGIDQTVQEVRAAVQKEIHPSSAGKPAPPPVRCPAPPPMPKKAPAPQPPARSSVPVEKVPPEEIRVLPEKEVPGRVSGTLMTVAGTGGILATAPAVLSLLLQANFASYGLILYCCLLAASSALTARGISLRSRFRRYRSYLQELGGASFCLIRALSNRVGKSIRYVTKDVQKMIRDGFFPQGHLDIKNTCLMLDDTTYTQYLALEERSRMQQESDEQLRSNPELEAVIREGEVYLRQIREANDAIPGEEISKKLDRLESITEKIFRMVQQRPEKLPEIRRFMSYYLPTTLKLVNAYRTFDAQPVQGSNLLSSKREIEGTLDTINRAFENLFDRLFAEETMDVSTDISVLQNMLKQEGLTENDFRKNS